jgi:hypothetical protein
LPTVGWSGSVWDLAVTGAEQMRATVRAAKDIKRMALLPIDIPPFFYP